MDLRRAGFQNAVGTCVQATNSDRHGRRMEVLDGIRAPLRRHDPTAQERLDRRKVLRRERMAKLTRVLRLGDDVE